MATIAELEKQIAGLNSQLKFGVGLQLREREEAAAFTRQLITKAEAAGDQAKVERETRVLGTILQEISTYKQEVAGIEAQRDQLQQELNAQKAAEQGQQATATAQQNNAQSAGQQVAQSGDAGVTNPSQPTQTFTSPDAATATATQPDPVVAVSNSNTPPIGTSSSPSPDAAATTTQTNAEEAVGQGGSLPPQEPVATRERSRTQSYVFYATTVTSEFRQGRFEQTLEGSLYIFPRPKTAQVVDPPVKAAELGSQSFGLTDNPRVNPGKKKVASAQDVRKATITPVAPTNVQFTGQASNLSNPDGMDFSAISGFGA
jgi:hypothetical protein